MTTLLYVVKDVPLEECGPVNEAKNDAVAVRNFQKAMKNEEFLNDFKLYCVGVFDHTTMKGEFHAPREVVVTLETDVLEENDARIQQD